MTCLCFVWCCACFELVLIDLNLVGKRTEKSVRDEFERYVEVDISKKPTTQRKFKKENQSNIRISSIHFVFIHQLANIISIHNKRSSKSNHAAAIKYCKTNQFDFARAHFSPMHRGYNQGNQHNIVILVKGCHFISIGRRVTFLDHWMQHI